MRISRGFKDLRLCPIGGRKTALFPRSSLNIKNKEKGDVSQRRDGAGRRWQPRGEAAGREGPAKAGAVLEPTGLGQQAN